MDQACRDQLVVDNLPLARYFSQRMWRYHPFIRRLGELEDAVQSACVALIRAATSCDPAKGRFSTWAGCLIHNHLVNEAAAAGPIAFPHYLLGRAAEKQPRLSAARHAVRCALWHQSIPDTLDIEATAAVEAPETSPALRRELALLPVRWRYVLTHRFGLDGAPSETLQAIGGTLGVCRERVRQLEMRGLERLRQHLETRSCR